MKRYETKTFTGETSIDAAEKLQDYLNDLAAKFSAKDSPKVQAIIEFKVVSVSWSFDGVDFYILLVVSFG